MYIYIYIYTHSPCINYAFFLQLGKYCIHRCRNLRRHCTAEFSKLEKLSGASPCLGLGIRPRNHFPQNSLPEFCRYVFCE